MILNAGAGIENTPNISVTQADVQDVFRLHEIEIKGRDFPLDPPTIKSLIQSALLYSITCRVDYRMQGWAAFRADGNDIFIERLTLRNDALLELVLEAMFRTITYTPGFSKLPTPLVTVVWPEHSTDHFIFKFLLANGWKTAGLERDRFEGYGAHWDGIKLVKQF